VRDDSNRSSITPGNAVDVTCFTSPFQILMLPGLYGAGPEHWQTQWEKLLSGRRIEQDDWASPRFDAWCARLENGVRHSNRPVVIIAHSLGTILATRWALTAVDTSKVAGAFLVAPPDLDSAACDRTLDIDGFAPLLLARLSFPSVVVASRNDKHLTFARAKELAAAWGSRLIDAGYSHHIGSDAGLGRWVTGLDWFKEFIASL
jgi:predicted alpha/beta hydrolase family esterase